MTAQCSLFASRTIGWTWRHLRGTSSARFSPCPEHGPDCECPLATYRYELRRTWDASKQPLVVIALNPSRATSLSDDPTCRRLYSFADRWGLGGVVLLNCFALRSTDPGALRLAAKTYRDPVGPDNDATIRSMLESYKDAKLLLAWGGHAKLNDRGRDVAAMAMSIHPRPECFGLTKSGQPAHPLYTLDAALPRLFAQLIKERAEASR